MTKYDVYEATTVDREEEARCLTDGHSFLWVYQNEAEPGFVSSFTRRAGNRVPLDILAAIEEEFATRIVNEYQPEYWGCPTTEEWDRREEERCLAWDTGIPNDRAEQFYDQYRKYIEGEPNSLRPETTGLLIAEMAKRLVAENPELKEDKSRLLRALGILYLAPELVIFPEEITEEKIAHYVKRARHNLEVTAREGAGDDLSPDDSEPVRKSPIEGIRTALRAVKQGLA